jgi:hypothetical protein
MKFPKVACALIALAVLTALACTCSDLVPPPTQEAPPTQPPDDDQPTADVPTGEPSATPSEGPTEPPPTVPPEAPTPTPTPRLPDATFVQDVTIPDNTEFPPGDSFTKVWRMRSDGSAPWPPGTTWAFVSGAQLGAPDSVPVPETPLGGTADVAVQMQAPTTPGTYRGYWQMRVPSGDWLGDRVYVQIVVPAPTPTPLTPSIVFVADRYTIHTGECAFISWEVENVSAVYYNGQPAVGVDSRVECPTSTTAYELRVLHLDGQWETRVLTIVVLASY